MLYLLPAALIALLFAWPAVARGISSNDQFRAIAATVPQPESPPMCCLNASTPLEPLNDEVLLSFEDWKKKQASLKTDGNNQSAANGLNASDTGTHLVVAPPDSNLSSDYISGSLQPPDISPHFRVPIIDRFNYANIDCSARVHTSHRSAKSPSSLLSSKKDRYMLSPCNSGREKQFVVVELCDDIRIDTVQLANFEFFSGVFKDFAVSVAKTYSTDLDGWLPAGTYRAKHVRGVQSFHPPTSLRDFYRFIRIDFLSHYGNEYFCPVSILRVYGLTQLEEWKWDVWQAESRVKSEKGPPAVQVVSMTLSSEEYSTFSTGTPNGKSPRSAIEFTTAEVVLQETEDPSSTTTVDDASSNTIPSTATTQSSTQAGLDEDGTIKLPITPSSVPAQGSSQSRPSVQSSSSTRTPSPASMPLHTSVPESSQPYESIVSSLDAHQQSQEPANSNHSTINIPSSTTIPNHSSIPSPSSHTSSSVVQAPPPPLPPAGESIYRMITNRLTAVENNQTLYMKYVEQQNGAIRDMIRRLGEDIGRLEGITRVQGLALQKAVNDWEKQRYQLQMEYKDVLRRMEILSHEIILEKRLGVAQLCLLLAVLVFLSLTRGSRANDALAMVHHVPRGTEGLRAWGRRHLSLSGDRSWLAEKSSEATDQGGWKEGIKGQNRMRAKSDTKVPNKRPKPLVLGHSNKDNILHAYMDDTENSRLPFPTSEPPLPHTILGSTMKRPRTRTISHSRSRACSGTATPVYSVAIAGNGHGASRRMTFQRPVTPTSKSHFVFHTPQGKSHSFGRSTTPMRPTEGSARAIPLPISQTSSWSGLLGVVPKSAKNWARTAHLHDVKSVKKRQEKTQIELAKTEGKRKRENMGTVEDGDVFLDKRSSRMALEDAVEPLSSQRCLLLELGSEFQFHQEPSTDVSLILPVGEDSDPWVDTDSASADDGNSETFESPTVRPSSTDDPVV